MSSSIHSPQLLQILQIKSRMQAEDTACDYINKFLLKGCRVFKYEDLCQFTTDVDFPLEVFMEAICLKCLNAGWVATLSEDFKTLTLTEKAK